MIRSVLAACLAVALVLSATIAGELGAFSDGTDSAAVAPARGPVDLSGGRTDAPVADDRAEEHAAAILARPLFSPTRRPAPPSARSASGGSGEVGLPRLTGVMVNGRDRYVIFAAAAGAKPLILGEGGKFGAFTVDAIEAGRVTVTGPDGKRTLQPQYDRSAAARPGPPGAPGFPAFGQPGAPPGVAQNTMPPIAAPVPPPANGPDPER